MRVSPPEMSPPVNKLTLALDVLTSRYRQEQGQPGKYNGHTLFRLSAMLFYTHHTHSRSHAQHC